MKRARCGLTIQIMEDVEEASEVAPGFYNDADSAAFVSFFVKPRKRGRPKKKKSKRGRPKKTVDNKTGKSVPSSVRTSHGTHFNVVSNDDTRSEHGGKMGGDHDSKNAGSSGKSEGNFAGAFWPQLDSMFSQVDTMDD